MRLTRDELVKQLWPDKVLYGCTLLFVTGLLGALHAGVAMVVPVDASANVPAFLLGWGPTATILLSSVTAGCAYVALREHDTRWAVAGSVVGFLTFALFGLGALFSLAALLFVASAKGEGEHRHPVARRLTVQMWPDKSLAASLLLLVGAVLALAWGLAVLTGVFALGLGAVGLAYVSVLGGVVGLPAAWTLYRQRAPWLGALAAVLVLASSAFYVVGPILGVAALVLLVLAWREKEFDPAMRSRLGWDAKRKEV